MILIVDRAQVLSVDAFRVKLRTTTNILTFSVYHKIYINDNTTPVIWITDYYPAPDYLSQIEGGMLWVFLFGSSMKI